MSSGRAFQIVLIAALGGAVVGAAIGVLLAILLPNYYRSVFEGPVDPFQTGLGLGISQGLIAGGVVGIGIVALLTWREVKLKEIDSRRVEDYPRSNR